MGKSDDIDFFAQEFGPLGKSGGSRDSISFDKGSRGLLSGSHEYFIVLE